MSSPLALRAVPEDGMGPLPRRDRRPHSRGGEGKEVVCCKERREPTEERGVTVGEGKEVVCGSVQNPKSRIYT